VSLLAPAAPAVAVVGPGPGEADEVLPWDGAEVAAILAGQPTSGPVAAALRSAEAVVAFTRDESLLATLRARTRCLIARDPAPPHGGPHASVWLAGALAPLGLPPAPDPPPLETTAAEQLEAERLTRGLAPGFLAVHPGSGSRAKNWPLERFVAAARALADGRPWLLVRGPAEEALPCPAGAVDASGWPLRILAAALSRAGLFLGNDSGVAHLAAACGTRTLALFGPTDPERWAPVGPGVATLRAPGGRLADLEVEAVVAAARVLVRPGPGLARP
jgi:ADP-heptose:LPS heptosyltransferase